MYLVDTNVISELRKGRNADRGVHEFLKKKQDVLFLPVQTVGELCSGVELLNRRGDIPQALRLRVWMDSVLDTFEERILDFDRACAETWSRLMGASDQNQIDKQIAAIALVYDLTIVTRNTRHFEGTGARTLNPFLADREGGEQVH